MKCLWPHIRRPKSVRTLKPWNVLTLLICHGMDYNANINWIVAGQPKGRRLNVVKSFYVKFERKIPALVQEFCQYYSFHRNKTVVYYYDSTALGSNYTVND